MQPAMMLELTGNPSSAMMKMKRISLEEKRLCQIW